jgi:hypothetical protein
MSYCGKGWHYESYRHSLAAKGIKTRNNFAIVGFIIPEKKDARDISLESFKKYVEQRSDAELIDILRTKEINEEMRSILLNEMHKRGLSESSLNLAVKGNLSFLKVVPMSRKEDVRSEIDWTKDAIRKLYSEFDAIPDSDEEAKFRLHTRILELEKKLSGLRKTQELSEPLMKGDYFAAKKLNLINIGVVGSRSSNELQKKLLEETLGKHIEDTIISGGCYAGADKWAEEFADEHGVKKVIFKPKGTFPKDFHDRNTEIVEASDALIATIPENPNLQRFAGTEQTVREAIDKGIPVTLIDPKGRVFKYNMAAKRVFKKGKYHATLSGSEVKKLARKVQLALKPFSKKIDIAGSIRRKVQEPVDVDLVVIPRDKKRIREKLSKMGTITASGSTMVEAKIKGVDVDTYFSEPESYGAQLMTRTGPWQGNLGNRTLAKNRGELLNQYGLYNRKTGRRIAGRTEKEIYEALGKHYKEPELRGK